MDLEAFQTERMSVYALASVGYIYLTVEAESTSLQKAALHLFLTASLTPGPSHWPSSSLLHPKMQIIAK